MGRNQATERLQVDSVEEKRINNGFFYSDSRGVGANYSESWD